MSAAKRHARRHESVGLGGRVSVRRAVRKLLQESEAQAEMVGGGGCGRRDFWNKPKTRRWGNV